LGRHQGIRRHDRRVISYGRRALITGLAATLLAPPRARAASVTDGAGRTVPVPARVERVFPAGPPAAIFLYTLAPELLIGWPRANRPEEREFLLPDIGGRPEVGRITGRGNTADLEVVLALNPDLIRAAQSGRAASWRKPDAPRTRSWASLATRRSRKPSATPRVSTARSWRARGWRD